MPEHPISLLITAGPTHEPIDAVRYLANRSSGRTGLAIVDAALRKGLRTTLLLGPTTLTPKEPHTHLTVQRFHSTADLHTLLQRNWPAHDILIMAAAVADYRPVAPLAFGEKWRRGAETITLELEPTPDLVAEMAGCRRPGQWIVGFALEPADRLEESAAAKLFRKGLDAIVANPLQTIDSLETAARVLTADGRWHQPENAADGPVSKNRFADWFIGFLLGLIAGEDRQGRRSRQ